MKESSAATYIKMCFLVQKTLAFPWERIQKPRDLVFENFFMEVTVVKGHLI